MGKIHLKGIKVFSRHGYYDLEQQKGGEFEVDLEIETIFSEQALKRDDISGTLNYEGLYDILKEEMNNPARLLEHVANNILIRVRSIKEVQWAKVIVKKCNPPFDGEIDYVAVELEK